MKFVVCIDPGQTTGFCALGFAGGIINIDTYTLHDTLEVDWSNRFWFMHYLTKHREAIGVIVIEKFKLFGNDKKMKSQINSEFPSVRVIGIVEAYAHELGLFDRIEMQEPASR